MFYKYESYDLSEQVVIPSLLEKGIKILTDYQTCYFINVFQIIKLVISETYY